MRKITIASIVVAVIVASGVAIYNETLASKAGASPAATLAGGRVLQAFNNVSIPYLSEQNSAWFDVSDCGRLDLFGSASLASGFDPQLGGAIIYLHAEGSIDAVDSYATLLVGTGAGNNILLGAYTDPSRGSEELQWNRDGLRNSPFVRVYMSRPSQSAQTADTTVSAWLYCSGSTSTGASVGGVAQQPLTPASVAGDRLSYMPAVIVLLAVAGIVGGGWYVQRKRAA